MSVPHAVCVITAGALLVVPSALPAQRDTATLEPVVVTVTRGAGRSVLSSPFAVTVATPDSARPGQRHTAVDESLSMVPGLSATNRSNPSQDPRLSIRGFGARSAFGVRGIRVLRDGMPLTLPDGQTPLDYLSLESVGRIEIMRGAASALYGNASGGVIDIRSAAPQAGVLNGGLRQWIGADGFSRTALVASGTAGPAYYLGDAAYTRGDGARAHSRQRAASGFARGGVTAGGTDYSLMMLALHNPLAQNPGALTAEEMNADREMADALSVRRNARKAVRQIQVGTSATRSLATGQLSFNAYGGARSLDNPLTFAIVEIGRHSYGAGASLLQQPMLFGLRNRMTVGAELQLQNDLRRNYATCADTVRATTPTATCPDVESERGVVTLDQRELVRSVGLYFNDEIVISDRFSLTAGVRADRVRFEVRDRLVGGTNPDDSGNRTLGAVSPIAGILARMAPTHSVYGNISSAFETPTATELGNQPDGGAGINPGLDPQRSTTVEAGVKGFARAGIAYDAALFSTRVRDELIPFEIPESNGRRYFRNAGRTQRQGAEVGASVSSRMLSLQLAWSYSRFRFDEYRLGNNDFSGNEIPGIPAQRLQAALTLKAGQAFAVIETEAASSAFLDDANSIRAPGYSVSHLRAGMTPFPRLAGLAVTVGIQNIFDRNYAASLAVNAARAKYFEPAPGRAFHVGVSVESRKMTR